MKKLIIDDIEVELTRKKIKNINLSVHAPNGRITLSVPNNLSEEKIHSFLFDRISWMKKQQQKFVSTEIPEEKEYITGEKHLFFGQEYTLQIIVSNRTKIEIADNHINLYIPQNTSIDKKESLMSEWYRSELKKAIPNYIEKYERLMKVKVEDWGIRKMKSRWGTCNIIDKRIWINLELSKKSRDCLEYIIVHEMAHLLERGHGTKFKEVMDTYYPNWKYVKAKLNGMTY
ncbi:SprT family zinc-dependent metalloprotease [Tissierella sp. Yu-01]|uniref:M48 family metallopeptidase n=1 Tax=Tissierella sp. Yu-01 TaxID=3035694 RepID=UPI00240E01F0|nr:SprT family zinc-dependent metalloprotease [Tissierella sp. Yu-01]WFA07694.1 SprT family zinc-dependent metalloprotease [Tissierella sp. Yu-01]